MSDNNPVMKKGDYTEALKENFDMEIQPEEFGSNHTLSIEGNTCDYHDKYLNDIRNKGNTKMDFSHIFRRLLSECSYYI